MRSRGRLAVLAGATVLLHALALSGLEWAWPGRPAAALPASAMQVRLVAATPLPDAVASTLADAATQRVAAPVAAPVAAMPTAPKPRPKPSAMPVAPAMPVIATAFEVARETAAATATAAPATAAAPTPVTLAATPAPAAPHEEAIPHYATQMPPPMLLRYEMHRGALRGTGELAWRPQADHYELRLDARIGPLALLSQSSTGGFDSAGMAPLRFTDQRMRKAVQAVNFQREAGKVSFSGPSTEYLLRPGMQDRLSWMVQLAAIVSAEPALRATGAKVSVLVVGSQGDASVWAFRCMGVESLQLGAGETQALSYVREPRDPYDTSVKVWLDAARHYLPVRADTKAGPNDPGIGLSLQEMQPLT